MTYVLDAAQVFTIFFIMLGPLKLLGPFAKMTRALQERPLRALALRAAATATAAMVAGGFLGVRLLEKWELPPAVLMLTGGIVFFLVSLRSVLEQFEPSRAVTGESAAPTPMQIAFPLVVTPYGMAAVMVLLASSHDHERTEQIVSIALGVMLLNLLAMLYARPLIKFVGPAFLQALGSVLGLMVTALSVQIIVKSLDVIGIIHL